MNYDTFQELVLDLILFWQSQCFNLVKPQVKINNSNFFNRFTHRHNATHVIDCLIVDALIIQKYVDIVCDVFSNKTIF